MNIISRIYEFLIVPGLYITVPLCLAGIARKVIIIISGREHGLLFPASHRPAYLNAGIYGRNPAMIFAGHDLIFTAVSTIFHIAVFAAPLTAMAHGILLEQSWQVIPPRFDPAITGACTVTAIAAGFFLLMRRIVVRHVFAVSSWRDYAAMISVLTPFVTGLLARESIGNYEIIMLIHCFSAHVLLLAIGWTRLGHMVFFMAGRIVISNLSRETPV